MRADLKHATTPRNARESEYSWKSQPSKSIAYSVTHSLTAVPAYLHRRQRDPHNTRKRYDSRGVLLGFTHACTLDARDLAIGLVSELLRLFPSVATSNTSHISRCSLVNRRSCGALLSLPSPQSWTLAAGFGRLHPGRVATGGRREEFEVAKSNQHGDQVKPIAPRASGVSTAAAEAVAAAAAVAAVAAVVAAAAVAAARVP